MKELRSGSRLAGKAFLVLPNTQQAKQVTFAFDDNTTNIDVIPGTEPANTPAYNLAGQQVGNYDLGEEDEY